MALGAVPGGRPQEEGNRQERHNSHRNGMQAAGVVVAEAAEMGTTHHEEDEEQRNDCDPDGEVAPLVRHRPTLSLARGRLPRPGLRRLPRQPCGADNRS